MEILLVLAMVLCAVIVWQILRFKKDVVKLEEAVDYSREPLVLETAAAAEDFLEAGQVAAILSGGSYLGTISVRLHPRGRGRVGSSVYMYDSGDLRQSFHRYREKNPELFLRDQEAFGPIETFLSEYGDCYDRERNALVYVSKRTLPLRSIQKQQLENALYERISSHPLADMESVKHIHTKYIGQ